MSFCLSALLLMTVTEWPFPHQLLCQRFADVTQRASNDNFHGSPFLNAIILHGKGETGISVFISILYTSKVARLTATC